MRIVTELLAQYSGPVDGLVESAKLVEEYVLGTEQDKTNES